MKRILCINPLNTITDKNLEIGSVDLKEWAHIHRDSLYKFYYYSAETGAPIIPVTDYDAASFLASVRRIADEKPLSDTFDKMFGKLPRFPQLKVVPE